MSDETVFAFALSKDELVAVLGLPPFPNQEGFGLGNYDHWLVRYPCGLEVSVVLLNNHSESGERVPDGSPARVWISTAKTQDAEHIRLHFPLAIPPTARLHPSLSGASGDWVVWRQDDNGVRDRVASFASQCEADHCLSAFEARGHKQTYWVQGPDTRAG